MEAAAKAQDTGALNEHLDTATEQGRAAVKIAKESLEEISQLKASQHDLQKTYERRRMGALATKTTLRYKRAVLYGEAS